MKQNRLNKFIAKLTGKKQQKYVDLRSFIKHYEEVEEYGDHGYIGKYPYIELNVWDVVEARKNSEGFGNIRKSEMILDGRQLGEMEFGYYPQHKMDSWEVEELMKPQSTGRTYNFENVIKNLYTAPYPEFRLSNGNRVIRQENWVSERKGTGFDKTIVYKLDKKNKYSYYKNEPVKCIIGNWEHLPKSINPDGDGKDSVIKICGDIYLKRGNLFKEEAFVVAPELLKLSGVKNIDNLIRISKQEECEKVL